MVTTKFVGACWWATRCWPAARTLLLADPRDQATKATPAASCWARAFVLVLPICCSHD